MTTQDNLTEQNTLLNVKQLGRHGPSCQANDLLPCNHEPEHYPENGAFDDTEVEMKL